MSDRLQKITLSGSPEEIGFQHGKSLASKIYRNIEFYKGVFLSNLGDEVQVLKAAKRHKEQIKAYNPDYITEIDHIALGAEVSEPLWLYALNSRTELTLTKTINECTAMVFPHQQIIGQTWDWAQPIRDNFVIMEIHFPSGHKILQLTEAGIIGKIGLNSNGLGQTLNILWAIDNILSGVPIHIVLRAVLEAQTLKEARNAIEGSGGGTASNIIVTQAGGAFDAEFAGRDTYIHAIKEDTYVHTNHYLHAPEPIQIDEIDMANSRTRYKTAAGKLGAVQQLSVPDMITILSDQSNGADSILAKNKPDTLGKMCYFGTLATVVMDLEKRSMKVRKGNPSSPAFAIDNFTEFRID
jgi:isopenicillin-N N-acyltransferase-like protein